MSLFGRDHRVAGLLWLTLIGGMAAGCTGLIEVPVFSADAGTDAGFLGPLALDPGTPDGGTPDAGTPDAGTPDAGTPDAGTPDAGTPDAGTPDAGTPDAGTPDAGTPDAGTPDAGTPDAGTPPTTSEVVFPSDATVINVRSYGAMGNGTTDDTTAIQNAIYAANDGQTIYFPTGTYLISQTLWSKYSNGTWRAWLRLQGQGQAKTTIRLKDSTFTSNTGCDPNNYPNYSVGNCRAVLYLASIPAAGHNYGEGLDAYMNSIQDMTLDLGNGNPGAIGVDVNISNQGALRNLTIKSEDGQGRFGIALTRNFGGSGVGPGYMKNITIQGLDYGIAVGFTDQMGITTEHLTLIGQHVAGINVHNMPFWVRDLNSTNQVPAVATNGSANLVLIDAQLLGGSSSVSAIQHNDSDGISFVRNVHSTGYQSAISRNGVAVAGADVTEWTSKSVQSLFSSVSTSIHLPTKETPQYTPPTDFTQWANVVAYGAKGDGATDDSAAIQAALDSGKPVVYFPYPSSTAGNCSGSKCYVVNQTLRIRNPALRLIDGMGSVIGGHNVGAPPACTLGQPGCRPAVTFSCEVSSGTGPIILKNFHYDKLSLGYTRTAITNTCTVPFVLQDNFDFAGYQGNTSADVFWEDNGILGVVISGGHFYGRQVNVETSCTHIDVNGGAVAWIFGFKTEGDAYNNTSGCFGMVYTHGATAEVLGAWNYPTNVVQGSGLASGVGYTIGDNANMSVAGAVSYGGFSPSLTEVRSGVSRSVTDTSWQGGFGFALYSGSTVTFP